jgi:hypothetical protein
MWVMPLPTALTIYNVTMPVLANVAASTPEQAQRILADLLDAHGFEAYPHEAGRPFEAEQGTEPSDLPGTACTTRRRTRR